MSKLSRAYKFILVSIPRNCIWRNFLTLLNISVYMGDINLFGFASGLSFCFENLMSVQCSFYNSSFQTLFTLHLDETYRICVPKQDYNLFVVSSFLLFVLPMSIITVLYILIGLQLRRSKIVQRSAFNGSSVRLKVIFWIFGIMKFYWLSDIDMRKQCGLKFSKTW